MLPTYKALRAYKKQGSLAKYVLLKQVRLLVHLAQSTTKRLHRCIEPSQPQKGYTRAGDKCQSISYISCIKVIKPQNSSKSTKLVWTQI